MSMTDEARAEFQQLLAEIRPKLHRYCARMTGSAVDGEDIVQDAMIKAIDALPAVGSIDNPGGWLFRIAHNTALDFLRRRAREPEMQPAEDLNMIADEPSEQGEEIAVTSLRTFLRLPALQRSAVILKDVLGHSIEEVSSITGATPAAAKSALQRGRERLRQLATEPEDVELPMLSDTARSRLKLYVDGFRTGDFDAVRQMLADAVKLDLVGKFSAQGKGTVGEYYGRYAAAAAQWAYAAGVVEGRPAMLVFDRKVSLETPAYFVALTFDGDRVAAIHDFLFARYAMDGVDLLRWDRAP
jgi:RNA polymerase sigma-70 factor (ECF subfamily)